MPGTMPCAEDPGMSKIDQILAFKEFDKINEDKNKIIT